MLLAEVTAASAPSVTASPPSAPASVSASSSRRTSSRPPASPSRAASPCRTSGSASPWSRRSRCSASRSASCSDQLALADRRLTHADCSRSARGRTVADGGAGRRRTNPILPIWQEIVVGAIAFAMLCFVLMKFVFPRMEQTFKARVEAIEGGIKRAEERQAEANALFEQYKLQLAEARTEAARIRQEARGRRRGHPAGRARPGPGGVRPHHRGRQGPARGRAADDRAGAARARSARSRSTWPAGSWASRWRTRRAAGAPSSGSSPTWTPRPPAGGRS